MSFGNLSDLGRLPFSERISEGLRRLEKKSLSSKGGPPPPESVLDFVSSHIFIHENEIQKLEVIRLLIDFFNGSSCSTPLFGLLFCSPSHDPLMQSLVSAGVGLKSSVLLSAAGNFLLSQKDPARLTELSKALLGDFLPNLAESLTSLPSLSHSLSYALLLVLPKQEPVSLLPCLHDWILKHPLESLLPPLNIDVEPSLLPPILSLPLWTLGLQDSPLAEDIHLTLLNFMMELQQRATPPISTFTLEPQIVASFISEVAVMNEYDSSVLDKSGQLLVGLLSSGIIPPSRTKELKPTLGKLKEKNHLLSMIYKKL